MSFFAILFALLIEQVRPLGNQSLAHDAVRAWVGFIGRSFDTGSSNHAALAWSLGVLGPAVLASVVYGLLLHAVGWPIALIWNIAVLYLTLGFRQFSHHFTRIREALDAGDEALARSILADWKGIEVAELSRSEMIRLVIEHSVLSAHRHVLGVFTWYSVLAALGLGPAGAVAYRLADYVRQSWKLPGPVPGYGVSAALIGVSAEAWRVIDWLPCRVTALGFAIVGSFEDAIDRWRQHTQRSPRDNDGVILAATSGALNLRLGETSASGGMAGASSDDPTDASTGREPQMGHLAQVVGLVWRSVVMWMVLLALLTLAQLLG